MQIGLIHSQVHYYGEKDHLNKGNLPNGYVTILSEMLNICYSSLCKQTVRATYLINELIQDIGNINGHCPN